MTMLPSTRRKTVAAAGIWLLATTSSASATTATIPASQQGDTCATFNATGVCIDLQNNYLNNGDNNSNGTSGLSYLMEESDDDTTKALYNQFLDPLWKIAMETALYDIDAKEFCWGDFTKEQLDEKCGDIPLKAGTMYGSMAGSITIPSFFQQALADANLWKDVRTDTMEPTFCMAMRIPTSTCHRLTFGMSLNQDAVTTFMEASPADTLGDALLSLSAAILTEQQDLEQVAVAFSFGGGLTVPVQYYYDRQFIQDPLDAHLHFTYYKGPIDLSMMPGGEQTAGIVKIDGLYQRSFHFGNQLTMVEDTILQLLDPAKVNRKMKAHNVVQYMEEFVGKHPEVITTTNKMTVDLSGFTRGLFRGITLEDTEIRALKAVEHAHGVRPGFYLSVQTPVEKLKPVVEAICDDYSGALHLVSGRGCPSLEDQNDIDTEDANKARLGLELRPNVMDLLVEWPEFFLRCKVSDLEDHLKAKLNCEIDRVVFGIMEADNNGWIIGKSQALTGNIQETVTEISNDVEGEYKGFGEDILIKAKLSSQASETIFQSVANYFEQPGAKREELDYGFQDKVRCKDAHSHRLWSSRAKQEYPHHFGQAGNDDSMASCFVSCYTWWEENGEKENLDEANMCCSYEEISGGNECRVGHKGVETTSDQRKFATTTFVKDFEELSKPTMVGEKCHKDEDCMNSYCHMEYCKNECFSGNKCFPSPMAKCFGQDDACMEVNGARHFCDRNTDSCQCDVASGRCERQPHTDMTKGFMTATKDDKSDIESSA